VNYSNNIVIYHPIRKVVAHYLFAAEQKSTSGVLTRMSKASPKRQKMSGILILV
jgi:hypothetical protein